jgi:hypothetical protein
MVLIFHREVKLKMHSRSRAQFTPDQIRKTQSMASLPVAVNGGMSASKTGTSGCG